MSIAAIGMVCFGFGVTWGGAAACIRRAMSEQ